VRFLALGRCQIGDRTIINRDCLLDNRDGLLIGSDVSIATGVKIFTQGHDINDELFSISRGQVTIADNVCIFANALIMPKVHLGKGCVVYPGSVVTKSFSDLEVIGGNPAKTIKLRLIQPKYKLNSDFWFN
jgi:maltose O-acetyltransferase